MNLNKFIQKWSHYMAKILKSRGQPRTFELPRVDLIAVPLEESSDPMRDKEIRDLLAKMILLAHKRGRPSAETLEEESSAA